MQINHNIAALNTYRQLNTASTNQSKSMEKLSSGLRINKAGDDAAGLAISEKMRGQIRGLDMASKNAQDGISLISTAEGALNETHSILQRMRELSVQASNDTNIGTDRTAIQEEINQLATEIDRISDTTTFNTQKLLDGNFTNKQLQIGADENQNFQFSIDNMSATALISSASNQTANASVKEVAVVATGTPGTEPFAKADVDVSGYTEARDLDIKIKATTAPDGTNKGTFEVTINGETQTIQSDSGAADSDLTITVKPGQTITIDTQNNWTDSDEFNIKVAGKKMTTTGPDVSTYANAKDAISKLDTAIETVSTQRSKLGAYQNRLEHTINNLNTSSENLTAAESRIRDVDYALAA
ncbi:flagellin [Bacillus sp. S3]|uniref:flagellin N-terminal helical domain-containing protein n=1 Tax=Bacillus sp. S3 TaxID=486398 RepID=UPI00118AA706|nr:flagellin [Bacillus sp. S3]QCJ42378.1 flagellin [Bacillus sp. S3]